MTDATTSSLRVRLLAEADLPGADALRSLAGWNQTLADWNRFLRLEPGGCFAADSRGTLAGTATTLVHGPALAWVGMVLVHPEQRRRGIGGALLERCLEYLRGRRIEVIKLDATPLGRPVYAVLGFREEWTLTRWERMATPRSARVGAALSRPGIRPWQPADLARVGTLDGAAFGIPRTRLLAELVREGSAARVAEAPDGSLQGYGLLRGGARAHYLGPVVAAAAAVGIGLIEDLLGAISGGTVFWDIPDANLAAVDWARERGFRPQRELTRMWLGANTAVGDPTRQFGLSGPETG